jgi:hypothetical protein
MKNLRMITELQARGTDVPEQCLFGRIGITAQNR